MAKKGILPGMLLAFILLFASQSLAQGFCIGVNFHF